MKIKFKDEFFETDFNKGYYEILYKLRQCEEFNYNEIEKYYEIKATILNYWKLKPIINNKVFDNYVNKLIKEKKSKPKPNLNIKTTFPFLYDFQIETIKKAVTNKHKGFLISLDAGLGKTITALCIMKLKQANKVFIMCPASLKQQWKEEILKWFPKFINENITIIEGTKLKRENLYKIKSKYYIIGYETFRNDIKNKHLQDIIKDSYLIMDECQKIKNSKSKIYKTFKRFNNEFKYKLFLTATPLSNKLFDFNNIINLIDNTLISNLNDYIEWKTETIGWGHNARVFKTISHYKNLKEYIKKVSPVYYRKNKKEVQNELPSRTFINVPIIQSEKHQKLSKQIIKEFGMFQGFSLLSMLDCGIEILQKSESESCELLEFPKTIENKKLLVLKELVDSICGGLNEFNEINQIIIFTHFINSANNVTKFLQENFKTLTIKCSNNQDKDIIRNDFNNKKIDILVVTDKFATGVSFSQIDYHINFDIIPNLETWYQRLERIFRLDSKNNKTVYNLIGDIIEIHIIKILKKKTKLFEAVVEGKINKIENIDIKQEIINKLEK